MNATTAAACALGLACWLSGPAALAADPSVLADAARRLPPSIASVATCASSTGALHYRVVVVTQGFEHVSSAVYLQWLRVGERGARLWRSVPVPELSGGFWSVAEAEVVSREPCTLQLLATHTYSLAAARFVLQPSANGSYRLRQHERP